MFQSLKKTAAETHRMLQKAFGDNAMSQRNTFLWYKRFRNGWTSVENDERSGRPSTCTTPENIANVREVILADRRQTIHDVCEIGLSYGTVQRILADNLNMRRNSARFVPSLLSDGQRPFPFLSAGYSNNKPETTPNFISNITTGDETWVHGYDSENKQQSSQWKSPNSPRPKRARQVRSNVKSILIAFFDIQGIFHKEFVPLVKPSMASFTVRFWNGWGRSFGANVQTSGRKTIDFSTMTMRLLTHHLLFNNSWLPNTLQWFPLHSPDLAPCKLFLFPKMKLRLKGRRFDTTEDIHAETQEVIDTLTFENFHEIMGNMLGSLYTCPRGLLRRRWWKLGVTVRNFFLWSNSPNFWVSPCSVSFHVTTSLVL